MESSGIISVFAHRRLPPRITSRPEVFLWWFKTKVLPLHPVLTLATVDNMPAICSQVEQQVEQHRVFSLILRLGAVAHDIVNPPIQDQIEDAQWTYDIISELEVLTLESILDIRTLILGVLLVVHLRLVHDCRKYMASIYYKLPELMRNNAVDLSNHDNLLTVWAFIFLAFETQPFALCHDLLPILNHMSLHMPDECIAEDRFPGWLTTRVRLGHDLTKIYGKLPHSVSELTDCLNGLSCYEFSEPTQAQLYVIQALAFRGFFNKSISDHEQWQALKLEVHALLKLIHVIHSFKEPQRLFFVDQEYDCLVRMAQAYGAGLASFHDWGQCSANTIEFLKRNPQHESKLQSLYAFSRRFTAAERTTVYTKPIFHRHP